MLVSSGPMHGSKKGCADVWKRLCVCNAQALIQGVGADDVAISRAGNNSASAARAVQLLRNTEANLNPHDNSPLWSTLLADASVHPEMHGKAGWHSRALNTDVMRNTIHSTMLQIWDNWLPLPATWPSAVHVFLHALTTRIRS